MLLEKDGVVVEAKDLDQSAASVSVTVSEQIIATTYISVVMYQRTSASGKAILLQDSHFEACLCKSGSSSNSSSSSANDDSTLLSSHA